MLRVMDNPAAFLLLDWRGQSPLAHEQARFLVEQGSVAIGDLYGDGFSPIDRRDRDQRPARAECVASQAAAWLCAVG
jgi:hypothetical protein